MTEHERQTALAAALALTEEERTHLTERIWLLLARQASRVTNCDSTSVTVEQARELLASLLYTLQILLEEGATKREMLEEDMELLLRRGQALLQRRCREALPVWQELCREALTVSNVYYRSTIMELGRFFKWYDVRFHAHMISCSIDYPLMHPVSEERLGISYVEEYLRCLHWESEFRARFDAECIRQLYSRAIRNVEEDYFNLCDPILAQAAALGLLEEDVYLLTLTARQAERIAEELQGKRESEVRGRLEKSADRVLRQTEIRDGAMHRYFRQAITDMTARLTAAAAAGDVSCVFTIWGNMP